MPVHIKGSQLCDDLTDCPRACQRERALLQNLRASVLGAVLEDSNHPRVIRVGHQIHRTADTYITTASAGHFGALRVATEPFTSFPGIMKLAMSPACETCMA